MIKVTLINSFQNAVIMTLPVCKRLLTLLFIGSDGHCFFHVLWERQILKFNQADNVGNQTE